MKVKKAFIKTRRTETHVTSEAYQYGGDNHGDAIGFQASVFREPHALGASIASPARQLVITSWLSFAMLALFQ